MKKIFLLFQLLTLYNSSIKNFIKSKEIINFEFNGIYKINFILNNTYFFINKNLLTLSDKYSYFNLIKIESNLYYIINRRYKKLLAINENNDILLSNKGDNLNNDKYIWSIIIIIKINI